jgi:hypothetical protein
MPATATTLDSVLKNYYNQKYVTNLIQSESAFMSKLTKNPNGTGKKNIFPIIYGADEGISATLANAQTIAAASGGSLQAEDWICSWGTLESSLQIDAKLIKQSASDMGSFIDAQKVSIDAHFKKWSQVLCRYLLTSKARNLGSFTESTGVCTLTNAADVVNYSKGMQVQASANAGTATSDALLGSGSIGYVIGVNPNAGTFTVSATDLGAAGTPSSWTGTMYGFRLGDFGGTSSPAVVLDGFADWCPAADPSATLFNSVDRTQNIMALSGVRLTAAEIAGLGLEARIRKLASRMFGRGYGAPEDIWMDPDNFLALAESLEARGIRDPIGKDATFGFQTIHVATPGGIIPIWAEKNMPYGAIYATRKDAFVLDSLGACPQYLDDDGLKMLRKATTNVYEIRLVGYPCTRAIPGYLGYTSAP